MKQVSMTPGPRNEHQETKTNGQKPAALPTAATGQQHPEGPGKDTYCEKQSSE